MAVDEWGTVVDGGVTTNSPGNRPAATGLVATLTRRGNASDDRRQLAVCTTSLNGCVAADAHVSEWWWWWWWLRQRRRRPNTNQFKARLRSVAVLPNNTGRLTEIYRVPPWRRPCAMLMARWIGGGGGVRIYDNFRKSSINSPTLTYTWSGFLRKTS